MLTEQDLIKDKWKLLPNGYTKLGVIIFQRDEGWQCRYAIGQTCADTDVQLYDSRLVSQEQEKANMLTQLNFLSKREVNDFFEEVILKKVSKTERKKGGIFIKDKNLAVFPFFSFTQVGKAEVVRAYNSIKATDTAYILSEKYTADVVSFANRFDGYRMVFRKMFRTKNLKEITETFT